MELIARHLGCQPYVDCWRAMQQLTSNRDNTSVDELWLLTHPPVYTLGQAGREAHLKDTGDIEVVRTDRGGQVTYHGPGQLIGYLMLDVKRAGLGVRRLVGGIEQSLVRLLLSLGLNARGDGSARGVYVEDRKIGAIGLRIRANGSYHGFSLNVDMDLNPFYGIDPCGYPGLKVTDIASETGGTHKLRDVAEAAGREIADEFGFNLVTRE